MVIEKAVKYGFTITNPNTGLHDNGRYFEYCITIRLKRRELADD